MSCIGRGNAQGPSRRVPLTTKLWDHASKSTAQKLTIVHLTCSNAEAYSGKTSDPHSQHLLHIKNEASWTNSFTIRYCTVSGACKSQHEKDLNLELTQLQYSEITAAVSQVGANSCF